MATAELLKASKGFGDWALARTGATDTATVQSTSADLRVQVVGVKKLISGLRNPVIPTRSLPRFIDGVNNADDYRPRL